MLFLIMHRDHAGVREFLVEAAQEPTQEMLIKNLNIDPKRKIRIIPIRNPEIINLDPESILANVDSYIDTYHLDFGESAENPYIGSFESALRYAKNNGRWTEYEAFLIRWCDELETEESELKYWICFHCYLYSKEVMLGSWPEADKYIEAVKPYLETYIKNLNKWIKKYKNEDAKQKGKDSE